jgi:hypothetical protein
MMAGFAFNPEPIITYMGRQATTAVMRATDIAVQHAKRHAPVRKLFKGSSFTTKNGFRAPVVHRVRAGDVQRMGHANSFRPLLRNRTGDTTTFFSGDFRRVRSGRLVALGSSARESTIGEQSPAAFGRFKATKVGVEGGTADTGEVAVFQKVGGGKLKKLDTGQQTFSGRNFLTSRGRFEVRSGRANFTSPSGITRVGGRLRGEIHAEGPEVYQGVIWGYVVSATKDPETGTFYPYYQEFGSAHNRPHPFLRPGLADSRGALKREIRAAVRLGPKQATP